jgi:hypothetical protein
MWIMRERICPRVRLLAFMSNDWILTRGRDTLIRHAKSHCLGRNRRITFAEASANPGEVGTMRNGEHTRINSRDSGVSQSPRDALQAQLQTIEISGSTPGRSVTEFNPAANVWDFQNLEFMEDTPLWTMDNGFAMNGIEDTTSGHLPGLNLQLFDYSGDNDISNGQEHSERLRPPVALDMRNIWFTKVQRSDKSHYHPSFLAESTTTSQPTSSPREPEIVDEECRRNLSRSLNHPFPQEDLLPSSGFLVGNLLPFLGEMLT